LFLVTYTLFVQFYSAHDATQCLTQKLINSFIYFLQKIRFQRVKPTASADATYFSSNTYSFGYGGIQQINRNTEKIIFSLWDQGRCDQDINPNCDTDDIAKTIAFGEGIECMEFGGKGTG